MEGAEEVSSFDETSVKVRTPLGTMEIEGEGLNVVRLDNESRKLIVEGRIDGIFYTEKQDGKTARGIRKLFR